MKTENVLTLGLLLLLFQLTFGANIESSELDCADFQTSLLGNILGLFSQKDVKSEMRTKLLLVTTRNPVAVNIRNYNYTELLDVGIDISKKTYVIVHGFQNDAHTEWVAQLKEELLKTVCILHCKSQLSSIFTLAYYEKIIRFITLYFILLHFEIILQDNVCDEFSVFRRENPLAIN